MPKTTDVLVMDLMRPAKTISKDTEIMEAIQIMRTEAEMLSVVDVKLKLIGAVSEYNLIKIVKHEPSSPMGDPVWFDEIDPETGRQPVDTIMTRDITTIKPNETVKTALKVMNSVNYRILHVVDSDGKLLGIIRMNDIFDKLLCEECGSGEKHHHHDHHVSQNYHEYQEYQEQPKKKGD
jgi:predicted transcriptional regulator